MAEREISLVKQPGGSYVAERGGRVVSVPVEQRFDDDKIDVLRARFEATQLLAETEDDPAIQEALIACKVASYDELVRRAGGRGSAGPVLLEKQATWRELARGSGGRLR